MTAPALTCPAPRPAAWLAPSVPTWGTVRVAGETELTAGAEADLTVHLDIEQDVPPRHTLVVGVHFVSDLAMLQCADEDAPAHLAVETGGVPCTVEPVYNGPVHGPGSFFPYRRYLDIHLPEGAPAGTTVTCRCRRVRMQTYEERLFNLRVAIWQDGRVVGYLGDAFYTVRGGPAAHLRVVAPTCVERGEAFSCRVVTCDRFGNKTGDPLEETALKVHVAGAGEANAPVRYDPEARLHRIEGLCIESDGVVTLEVCRAGEPALRGRSNPIVVRAAWPERVFWGDMHQHAYTADGRGRMWANYLYGRDTSCLDFCAVAPHQEKLFDRPMLFLEDTSTVPVQAGWEELVEATEALNQEGFATILGSEAGSLGKLACHMNSYYLNPRNTPEIQRLRTSPDGEYADHPIPSYEAYLEELDRSCGPVLLLPHAHAGGGPGRHDLPVRDDIQTNVEITSVHGVFEAFYQSWLAHGHRVGVHGSGDNHMTSTGQGRPGLHYPNTNGLAAAWAPRDTREGIWQAFASRRTYAATGNQRVFLELICDGAAAGGICPAGAHALQITIAGTAPLLCVELLQNNAVVRTWRPPVAARTHLRLAWTDSCCSRRVDDSVTTGRVNLPGAALALSQTLRTYNHTDAFVERNGGIDFRSNAYSGIARGFVAEVRGAPAGLLTFAIDDRARDERVLDETIALELDGQHGEVTRVLTGGPEWIHRPVFSPQPHTPVFTLQRDWVDLQGPEVFEDGWTVDARPGDFCYLRFEQLDGTRAWSSPIWFEG